MDEFLRSFKKMKRSVVWGILLFIGYYVVIYPLLAKGYQTAVLAEGESETRKLFVGNDNVGVLRVSWQEGLVPFSSTQLIITVDADGKERWRTADLHLSFAGRNVLVCKEAASVENCIQDKMELVWENVIAGTRYVRKVQLLPSLFMASESDSREGKQVEEKTREMAVVIEAKIIEEGKGKWSIVHFGRNGPTRLTLPMQPKTGIEGMREAYKALVLAGVHFLLFPPWNNLFLVLLAYGLALEMEEVEKKQKSRERRNQDKRVVERGKNFLRSPIGHNILTLVCIGGAAWFLIALAWKGWSWNLLSVLIVGAAIWVKHNSDKDSKETQERASLGWDCKTTIFFANDKGGHLNLGRLRKNRRRLKS